MAALSGRRELSRSVTVKHGSMKHKNGFKMLIHLHAKSSAKAFFCSPCEILVLLGENKK